MRSPSSLLRLKRLASAMDSFLRSQSLKADINKEKTWNFNSKGESFLLSSRNRVIKRGGNEKRKDQSEDEKSTKEASEY